MFFWIKPEDISVKVPPLRKQIKPDYSNQRFQNFISEFIEPQILNQIKKADIVAYILKVRSKGSVSSFL